MTPELVHPRKARPGERIAVISPSFAAAGAFPEVREQAMRRLAEVRRAPLRNDQRDTVVDVVTRYNPEAVVCVGVPFGHTRPQWILPHGGTMTVDGAQRRIFADYR